MLLIYYNPNLNNFYFKINTYYFQDYILDSTNSYGHILIQVILITKDKLINVDNWDIRKDIRKYKDLYFVNYSKPKLKNVLINKLIDLLEKLKGKE